MRYLDDLAIGLLACHRLVPDLDVFSAGILDAFEELLAAAGV